MSPYLSFTSVEELGRSLRHIFYRQQRPLPWK